MDYHRGVNFDIALQVPLILNIFNKILDVSRVVKTITIGVISFLKYYVIFKLLRNHCWPNVVINRNLNTGMLSKIACESIKN